MQRKTIGMFFHEGGPNLRRGGCQHLQEGRSAFGQVGVIESGLFFSQ